MRRRRPRRATWSSRILPTATSTPTPPAASSGRDHRLLASRLRELVKQRACAVVAFNAPGAASLYHWATVEEVSRSGRISCKGDGREDVAEILITAGLARRSGEGVMTRKKKNRCPLVRDGLRTRAHARRESGAAQARHSRTATR